MVRADLTACAAAFAGRALAEIHTAELAEWVATRAPGAGRARLRTLRAHLVGFWRWARRAGIAGPDPVTAAEQLPRWSPADPNRRVLTADELRAILRTLGEPWLPWAVFQAFAGFRPEEVGPSRRWGKSGLRWEHLDRRFSVIRVPAEVSKTRRPRIVPILPTLAAWLDWLGHADGWTGAVSEDNAADCRETTRVGRVVFGAAGWPVDALRHSYGSYRNADLRNLPQVAEEMGSSVAMLHRHYHDPRTTGEAADWWGVLPDFEAGKRRVL
jgi:integrase